MWRVVSWLPFVMLTLFLWPSGVQWRRHSALLHRRQPGGPTQLDDLYKVRPERAGAEPGGGADRQQHLLQGGGGEDELMMCFCSGPLVALWDFVGDHQKVWMSFRTAPPAGQHEHLLFKLNERETEQQSEITYRWSDLCPSFLRLSLRTRSFLSGMETPTTHSWESPEFRE